MNRRILFILILLVSVALKSGAQGTTFNYQGRLNDGGTQANGSYDLRFTLYDAVTNGSRISALLTNSAVAVSNGLFSVNLDFGAGVFAGNNAWLDLGVRAVGVTNFTSLSPRQPVLPVPYAMFSTTASNLAGTLSAAQLTGTVPSSQVSGTYSNPVNFTNGGNNFSGAFTGTISGNGSALINLNASQLTIGTVGDARLTTNVALLDHSQTYSGANTFTGDNAFNGANNFTNRANNFTGSFFGNGNIGWIVVSNTAVSATANHGYLLTNPQFTTVTLPATGNVLVGDIMRISGASTGGWRVQANTNQSFLGNFSSYRNSLWVATSVGGGQWYSLAASADGTRMYAAGSLGVEASTDAGHNWGGAISALAGSWNSVATSADGLTVLAAVPSKAIQISTNAGSTWGKIGSGLASNAVAVACSADASKAIASNNGDRVYTNSPTAIWASIGVSGGKWNVVAYAGSGNNFAAGNTLGNVYTLAGGSVTVTNSRAVTGLVISTDGTKLAACFNPGGIYTSTNGGVSWTNSAAPWTNWNSLAASANCNQLFAGVSNGVIYASGNFGANWTAVGGVSNSVWSALTVSADASKLAAGASGTGTGLYYSSASTQSTTSTNGVLSGSQGTAVELQYIGNNQFMPVSSAGALWAN